MTSLEKSVLKVLAYFDVLSRPLSGEEIFYNLQFDREITVACLEDIKNSLKILSSRKLIEGDGQFFFLRGREELIGERRKRENFSEKYLEKSKKIFKKINRTPFLKGVFISGSLGMKNASAKSDIDLLVIAKKGRIFTVRFFLTLILDFLGQRRKPGDIAGKVCLNHYLAEDALEVKGTQNIYGAYLYFHNLAIIDRDNVFEKFGKSNSWMSKFLIFWERKIEPPFRVGKKSKLAKFLEKILSGSFGDFIEKKLKQKQIKRKEKNYPKGVRAGRVVLKDDLIELFPDTPEDRILKEYQDIIQALGIDK